MIIKIRLGLVSVTRSYFKLNRVPFAVKVYIGFVLLVFLLMGITYLHAYIKRPEQMQSLQSVSYTHLTLPTSDLV